MKTPILLALLSATACAPPVNYDLISYVRLFKSEAQVRGLTVSSETLELSFAPTVPPLEGEPPYLAGRCHITDHPEVTISLAYWEQLSWDDTDREVVMFHELGHCLLGRGHSEDGVMKAPRLRGEEYEKRRADYLDALFLPEAHL